MTILPLTSADAPRILPLLEDFTAATAVRDILPVDAHSAETFLAHLDGPLVFGFAALAGPQSHAPAAGFILGSVTPYPWNAQRLVAQEMAWWVCPGYRGGQTGRALLDAFETSARSRGAHVAIMLCEHGLRHETVGKLYARKGYAPLEHSYIKVL